MVQSEGRVPHTNGQRGHVEHGAALSGIMRRLSLPRRRTKALASASLWLKIVEWHQSGVWLLVVEGGPKTTTPRRHSGLPVTRLAGKRAAHPIDARPFCFAALLTVPAPILRELQLANVHDEVFGRAQPAQKFGRGESGAVKGSLCLRYQLWLERTHSDSDLIQATRTTGAFGEPRRLSVVRVPGVSAVGFLRSSPM